MQWNGVELRRNTPQFVVRRCSLDFVNAVMSCEFSYPPHKVKPSLR